MYQSEIYIARLVVSPPDIFLQYCEQILISCLVALHKHIRGLFDHEQVIILIYDFKIVSVTHRYRNNLSVPIIALRSYPWVIITVKHCCQPFTHITVYYNSLLRLRSLVLSTILYVNPLLPS